MKIGGWEMVFYLIVSTKSLLIQFINYNNNKK